MDQHNRGLFFLALAICGYASEIYDGYAFGCHLCGLGTWHFVCIVWDGTTMKGYFDDNVSVTLAVGSAAMQDFWFTVGANANGTNSRFNGDIDNVIVIPTNFFEPQVKTLYEDTRIKFMKTGIIHAKEMVEV